MLRAFIFSFFGFAFVYQAPGQDRRFAQKVIDTLASKVFSGRGYINSGDTKAASFISEQFSKAGLEQFKKSDYFYPFSFWVNTFPGQCKVKAGRKKLVPGKDFIVHPGCPRIKGTFTIRAINGQQTSPVKTNNKALLYDTSYKPHKPEHPSEEGYDLKMFLQKKLTWSVSTTQEKKAGIDILKASFPASAKKVKVKIESRLIEHKAYNVLGYTKGTATKDTFIVLTAHYDHLGMMGKTIFPGANDNASGVAMMLDLANYFKLHPCKYSIAFIAFAGEEPGLIGSKDYTDNPWDELPLSRIKFLINLDLMGSGDKGMAVVNATIFPDYFNKLKAANTSKNYLSGFKTRGKAANSDHYWFVERGVKGFFFYLMGEYSHYHDINDNRDNLKLGEYYNKSFLLIRDFILLI